MVKFLGMTLGWGGSGAATATAEAPLVRTSDNPFRAARTGRASSGFEGQRRHINSAIQQGGVLLRERSRFFYRENPLGISAKELWTAYSVGCGILPMPYGLTTARRKALMQAFYAWCETCDYDGRLDFAGMQAMTADEDSETGEIFFRLHHSPDQPLRLQLMTSEQLPYSVINPAGREADNTVRLGIECAPDGRRVAYHFLAHHPGDGTVQTSARATTVRVPAEQILHVYRMRQPGQLRGLPRGLGALVPANKLAEYDAAMIERAISGSKVSGIIKKAATDRESNSGVVAGAQDNKDGTAVLDFEVGTILELEADEDWNTVDPPDPGANYAEFTYRNAAQACAAMGVPYLETTGDLRKAPFSAVRAGRMPFKRRIEQFQHLVLVPQLLRPIWLAWLRDGLLRGTIVLPRGSSRAIEPYTRVNWVGPKWEYIEPLKDRQAEVLAVDNLLEPRGDIIAQRGEDADEVDRRIQQDQRREKRLGLERRGASAAATGPKEEDEDEDDRPDPDEDEDR